MKECTRCHKIKDDSEFRKRIGIKKGKAYPYLNPTCRQCDKEVAAIYYAKHKDDPAFKQKARDRVKRYAETNPDKIKQRRQTKEYLKKHAQWENKRYHKMKDVIAAKMKVKRQTKEFKEKMKAYRARNKEKIHQQEVITKRRYHEKNRDAITDKYAINLLRTQGIREPDKKTIVEKKKAVAAKRVKDILRKL